MSALALVLAAFAATASAQTAAPSRQDYLLQTLKSMRTVQGSYMGAEERDGGELMNLALTEAVLQINKDELSNPAPVADPELEDDAIKTMRQLASAYALKQRSRFMRYVSSDYLGNSSVLEDALVSDFRAYNSVTLDLRPDRVTKAGREASIEFHYNLALVDASGTIKKFDGTGNFVMRRDRDGTVRLYRMTPMIFGNTLPPSENPVPGRQGTAVSGGSTPGFGAQIQQGSVTLSQGGPGFRFDPPGLTNPSSADVVKLGADLNARRGIVSIGSCSLDSVTTVPTSMTGNFAPINTGECYALRTPTGKYVVLRVASASGSSGLGPTSVGIAYLLQTNGSNSFR